MNLPILLEDNGVRLTLVDVGASGGTYPPFARVPRTLARRVEIDPDGRNFATSDRADGTTVVRKAISESESASELTILLTRMSGCSSSLEPDFGKLDNFPYADWFTIVDRLSLPATSLNRLAAELGTDFNWIKLDTQGTELRILQSIAPDHLARVACVDIEASLYAHYKGADTFPELHSFMVSNGYYISDIVGIQERVRMRRVDEQALELEAIQCHRLKAWPTSIELRYMRMVNHDAQINDIKALLHLWTVAYYTENYPYCYFLARRLMETVPSAEALGRELLSALRPWLEAKGRLHLVGRFRKRLGSFARTLGLR